MVAISSEEPDRRVQGSDGSKSEDVGVEIGQTCPEFCSIRQTLGLHSAISCRFAWSPLLKSDPQWDGNRHGFIFAWIEKRSREGNE
jgi:hypothetical protein